MSLSELSLVITALAGLVTALTALIVALAKLWRATVPWSTVAANNRRMYYGSGDDQMAALGYPTATKLTTVAGWTPS